MTSFDVSLIAAGVLILLGILIIFIALWQKCRERTEAGNAKKAMRKMKRKPKLKRQAPAVRKTRKKRLPGSAKGQILGISPDFEKLPDDFKEYI